MGLRHRGCLLHVAACPSCLSQLFDVIFELADEYPDPALLEEYVSEELLVLAQAKSGRPATWTG